MLERIKLLLNVTDRDDLLNELIVLSNEKIAAYIGQDTCPVELDWITVELVVQRFNRIGSEGLSVERIDGGANTYIDDELAPFYKFLDDYKAMQNGNINLKGYKLF